MDDLMVCERSVADIEKMVELMDRILTTVGLALPEAKTSHMGIEWMETERRMKYQLRMGDHWSPPSPGEQSKHRVFRGETGYPSGLP
jgi:hypothetical protein